MAPIRTISAYSQSRWLFLETGGHRVGFSPSPGAKLGIFCTFPEQLNFLGAYACGIFTDGVWYFGTSETFAFKINSERSPESCAGEISAAPTVCRSGAGSAQCLAQQDTPWPGSISCLAISVHLQRWCRRYLIRGDGVLQGRITSSGGATGVNLLNCSCSISKTSAHGGTAA